MKGVADFVLAVLHYSQGEYSVEEIEDLILLIEAGHLEHRHIQQWQGRCSEDRYKLLQPHPPQSR